MFAAPRAQPAPPFAVSRWPAPMSWQPPWAPASWTRNHGNRVAPLGTVRQQAADKTNAALPVPPMPARAYAEARKPSPAKRSRASPWLRCERCPPSTALSTARVCCGPRCWPVASWTGSPTLARTRSSYQCRRSRTAPPTRHTSPLRDLGRLLEPRSSPHLCQWIRGDGRSDEAGAGNSVAGDSDLSRSCACPLPLPCL